MLYLINSVSALSLTLSIYLSISHTLSIYLSLSFSLSPSHSYSPHLYQSIYLSISLSHSLHLSLSIYLSISLSPSLYHSLHPSLSPSLSSFSLSLKHAYRLFLYSQFKLFLLDFLFPSLLLELRRRRPIQLLTPSIRLNRGLFSLSGLVSHLRTLLPKDFSQLEKPLG